MVTKYPIAPLDCNFPLQSNGSAEHISANEMLVEIACHLCSEAIESSCVILRSLLPDTRKEEDVFQMLQLQNDSVSIHLYP